MNGEFVRLVENTNKKLVITESLTDFTEIKKIFKEYFDKSKLGEVLLDIKEGTFGPHHSPTKAIIIEARYPQGFGSNSSLRDRFALTPDGLLRHEKYYENSPGYIVVYKNPVLTSDQLRTALNDLDIRGQHSKNSWIKK